MRKIIGVIGATLAIAAIAGGLSLSKDIPLGDGVDQATATPASAGGVQGHGTMDTYASLLEFSTSADEQRTQFVGDFNRPSTRFA